jgi:hypothetical protein
MIAGRGRCIHRRAVAQLKPGAHSVSLETCSVFLAFVAFTQISVGNPRKLDGLRKTGFHFS